MDGSVLWVVIAAACGVGEMLSGGLFLAPFAVGALLAAVAAEIAGFGAGVIAFIVTSMLVLVFVRPLVRAHLHTRPQLRTGAAALVGRRATVLERIANDEGVGRVRIDGEVWTARSLFDDQVIEPGARVEVVEIKGATALVTE